MSYKIKNTASLARSLAQDEFDKFCEWVDERLGPGCGTRYADERDWFIIKLEDFMNFSKIRDYDQAKEVLEAVGKYFEKHGGWYVSSRYIGSIRFAKA